MSIGDGTITDKFAVITKVAAFLSLTFMSMSFAVAQEAMPSIDKLVDWKSGPKIVRMEDIAEVKLPKGYVFTGTSGTKKLMQLYQNPLSGQEIGYIQPKSKKACWFVVYEFDPVGYVKDDEKDELDADEMYNEIKRATEASNEERIVRGWKPLRLVGWAMKPKFNDKTKNLEWALKVRSGSETVINYNTRVLGREGVMRVSLVVPPKQIKTIFPKFRRLMKCFRYQKGKRYAEYRQGDKMAEYGLKALMIGGTAAVLVKSGAFRWIWKVLVFVVLAIGGLFKKIFGYND